MIEKSPEAFRTISEVAEELDLPQHVLRFWETRFSQIKPLKRGGGRRYYRPEDINLLKGIRHLLYGEGYTIKGVQRILKEQGVRYVALVWEEPEEAPPEALPEVPEEAREDVLADATQPASTSPEPPTSEPIGADLPITEPFVPEPIPAELMPPEPVGSEPVVPVSAAPVPPVPAPGIAQPQPVAAPVPVASATATPAPLVSAPRLSTGDVRQLKAALFELIECKRVLDAARPGAQGA